MTRTPILLVVAALAAGSAAAPTLAQGVFVAPPPSVVSRAPLTGKRRHVAEELRNFGYDDVDLGTVSDHKIALLDHAIHADGSHGRIRSRIYSILYGGFLQRSIERIGRRY